MTALPTTTHMTAIFLSGDDSGVAWWVPWTSGPTGAIRVYGVGILGASGARALAAVIAGGHGSQADIEDHEGFLAAMERACDEPECLGHQVRRLTVRQIAEVTDALAARKQPN